MKIFSKIWSVFYILLFFLLTLQTRYFLRLTKLESVIWEYKTISIYVTDIIILVLLVLFIYYWFKYKKHHLTKLRWFWYGLAVWELFIFISIFFAQDVGVAIYKYITFLLGVALLVLFLNFKKNKKLLLQVFLVGVVLQAGLGIFQFLTQTGWENKYLGLAKHDPAQLGTYVVETDSGRWLRAYGTLGHPNILASVLVVVLLLTLHLLATTNFKPHYSFLKYLYYFIYLILLQALFFTFSRGAWLALVVSLFLYLLYVFRYKTKFIYVVKVLGFSAVFVLILGFMFKPLVETRLTSDSELEQTSNTQRIEQLFQAKHIITDNLWLGTGVGNYTLELKNRFPEVPYYRLHPVHNTYLLILAEIGIFGFLAFISFLGIIAKEVLSNKKEIKISLLVAMLIMLGLEHWWWSLHFGILLFFFVSAFLLDKDTG